MLCGSSTLHKGQLQGEAKATRVPSGRKTKYRHKPFPSTRKSVMSQLKTGKLQVVHLPDTVVGLRRGAFRRCYVLGAVTAPGCKQFGIMVFEACCSLTQIGTTQDSDNILAPQAQLRPRAFEGCTACVTSTWTRQSTTLYTRTEACLNVVFWKQELSPFPCRQILTGWDRPPVRVASSCKPLTCPEQTSSRYWARPLHTAHNCNNSASPETYES